MISVNKYMNVFTSLFCDKSLILDTKGVKFKDKKGDLYLKKKNHRHASL